MTTFGTPVRSTDWYRQQGKLPPAPGGGGGGGATAQGQALATPAPVTASTPVNPMQQESYNRAAGFESNLAQGTNEEITRELGRARDDISAGAKSEGEAAMARGADPTLFRSNALAAGARNLGNLQGRLADVALEKRQGAINSMGNLAGQAAGEQRQMQLGTLAAQSQSQRDLVAQAEVQARLNEAPYQRLLEMLKAQGGLLGGGVGIVGGGQGGGYAGGGSSGGFGGGASGYNPAYNPGHHYV